MTTISTLGALALVHRAEALAPTLPEPQRGELRMRANAVMSIVARYMRAPHPTVLPAQAQAVQTLENTLAQLRAAQEPA